MSGSFLERNKHDPWGRAYKIVTGRGKTFLRADQRELPPRVTASADPLRKGELIVAFSMLKSRKSPGADGFTDEMCKSVWKSIPDYLNELYGRCVSEGYFPYE